MKNINWREELDLFFTALMFLTRIPSPKWVKFEERYLNESARYFPLVGLVVGVIAAVAYALLSILLGPLLAIILSMALTIWVTGAFHEDGLADMCDGFGGGWKKDQILHIMKDSRLGTYGSVGLFLVIAIKFMALLTLALMSPDVSVSTAAGVQASLPLLNGDYSSAVVVAFLVAHPLSRLFSISFIHSLEYVQDIDQSKVRPLASHLSNNGVLFAGLSVVAVLMLLNLITVMSLLSVLFVMHIILSRYLVGKIGGYTGDCLGAAQQLSEVMVYIVLCAFISY
ncbi:adenosylcobinamide-GDP ribazoletransferase [Alkalimarinus alittae]|uniref:Adenosylcobinamide-GDP ribazoletransferase n=1 Tax=Alkalimarinus alittae TaxID=2961619 RepID=A0ABY6N3P8_9ALTE|nr:adenosylcobinamide-GDP ribazoletransferase [Alkalimarinus alittae]UZE96743.1 adenosylcobinamide-GDP ribazoletransferase [Alkalimarinus alittae]